MQKGKKIAAQNLTRLLTPHALLNWKQCHWLRLPPLAWTLPAIQYEVCVSPASCWTTIHGVPPVPETFIESCLCQTDKCWPNIHFDFLAPFWFLPNSWGGKILAFGNWALCCVHHIVAKLCWHDFWWDKGFQMLGFFFFSLNPLPAVSGYNADASSGFGIKTKNLTTLKGFRVQEGTLFHIFHTLKQRLQVRYWFQQHWGFKKKQNTWPATWKS